MASSFYSKEELKTLGLKSVGSNVLISRKCSIYGAQNISVGDNVRVDDFCILSGNITIGSHIHIAAYTALYGGDSGIVIEDFANLSSRICVYSVSDDYSGETMTNPMIPDEFKNVESKPVLIKKHVIIGTNCTVLPGVTIGEGTAVGCMSLVNKSLDEWGIYVGVPCKFLKPRKKDLLEKEKEFLKVYKK